MSKIIILKAVSDTVNINKFEFKNHSIEIIQVTNYLEKYLKIDKNKNIFNKVKYKYYKCLVLNELKNIIKEDSIFILSKALKKYKNVFIDLFSSFYNKYKIDCKINEETINIDSLLYNYIKNIDKIYNKNVAFLLEDINKLDKNIFINIAKVTKKLDIINKKLPKINRINKFIEDINNEYGMFNEIKDIKDLRDYSIIVNLDKSLESLQLFTYNKQAIYIDCKNIFTREGYNYLIKYNINKYIDKEYLNILKYLDILKDEKLYKNINMLYKENQIYISELLYLLNN